MGTRLDTATPTVGGPARARRPLLGHRPRRPPPPPKAQRPTSVRTEMGEGGKEGKARRRRRSTPPRAEGRSSTVPVLGGDPMELQLAAAPASAFYLPGVAPNDFHKVPLPSPPPHLLVLLYVPSAPGLDGRIQRAALVSAACFLSGSRLPLLAVTSVAWRVG